MSRYNDGGSRAAALHLVAVMAKGRKGEVAVTALAASLHDTYKRWADIKTSKGCAKTALAGLRWTAALVARARLV